MPGKLCLSLWYVFFNDIFEVIPHAPYQKLASICSVALKEMNVELLGHVKQLLSEDSPIVDSLVQEAALKSTSVLVQK